MHGKEQHRRFVIIDLEEEVAASDIDIGVLLDMCVDLIHGPIETLIDVSYVRKDLNLFSEKAIVLVLAGDRACLQRVPDIHYWELVGYFKHFHA